MSDLTQIALEQFLSSNSILNTLLARDPNSDSDPQAPAIFASESREIPGIYPQLVMMETFSGPSTDKAFSGRMKDEMWMLQVWDDSDNPVVRKKIARIVEGILHEKSFPILSVPGGEKLGLIHFIEKLHGGPIDGFNTDLKAHFTIQQFHIVYSILGDI